MATGLRSYVSPTPGWVSVACYGDAMAGWLVRAIVMENVAARRRGAILELPAAPHFRLEKEIKNVVTVIAKTCHYWLGHMPRDQQRAVAEPVRDDGRGIAVDRTRSVECRRANRRPRARRERGCTDSPGHRSSAVAASVRGLARRRVPECPRRGVDDARARRQQRPVAAGRDGPLRAGQCRGRSPGRHRLERCRSHPPVRVGTRTVLNRRAPLASTSIGR